MNRGDRREVIFEEDGRQGVLSSGAGIGHERLTRGQMGFRLSSKLLPSHEVRLFKRQWERFERQWQGVLTGCSTPNAGMDFENACYGISATNSLDQSL